MQKTVVSESNLGIVGGGGNMGMDKAVELAGRCGFLNWEGCRDIFVKDEWTGEDKTPIKFVWNALMTRWRSWHEGFAAKMTVKFLGENRPKVSLNHFEGIWERSTLDTEAAIGRFVMKRLQAKGPPSLRVDIVHAASLAAKLAGWRESDQWLANMGEECTRALDRFFEPTVRGDSSCACAHPAVILAVALATGQYGRVKVTERDVTTDPDAPPHTVTVDGNWQSPNLTFELLWRLCSEVLPHKAPHTPVVTSDAFYLKSSRPGV